MPSGLIKSYEYNADNQLVRQSDNRGRAARVERDAGGNITKFINQNTEVEVSRDEAGRIVQVKNSRGQSRRYVYDSRGALIRFVGADGRDLRFQYNARGEMQSVLNAQNGGSIFQRNRRGILAKIQQNTNRNDFWQMQKISYASSPANTAVSRFCTFGDAFYTGGEGWMDSWGSSGDTFAFEMSVDGGGCYDPFAGMFGGGGGGETCSQCRQRETRNCESAFESSMLITLGGAAGVAVGCVALTAGWGLFACGALVIGGQAAIGEGHRETRTNCLANINSKCETKCN